MAKFFPRSFLHIFQKYIFLEEKNRISVNQFFVIKAFKNSQKCIKNWKIDITKPLHGRTNTIMKLHLIFQNCTLSRKGLGFNTNRNTSSYKICKYQLNKSLQSKNFSSSIRTPPVRNSTTHLTMANKYSSIVHIGVVEQLRGPFCHLPSQVHFTNILSTLCEQAQTFY